MKEIYNYTYTIKNLIKEFDRGVFAVPEIQREFVWNAKKAGRIYYSLWQEDDVIFEYIMRPDPEWHVRLTDILDPRWRYRMAGMPKYKMSRIMQCRKRILNYNFHMIFVRTNNIEEVRETFIRIKAQGTPISAAD